MTVPVDEHGAGSPERSHQGDQDWLCPTPRSLKSGSSRASPCPSRAASSNVIKDLKGLLERAASTKHSAESLQEVLASYEDQVVQVHEELLRVTKKMQRERRQYSLRVLEKDCETKRLVVEAESLRGIVEAKSAAMEALKKRHAKERAGWSTRMDALEVALKEARETQNESLKRFEDAGIEIDTAAERLLEAYSENSSLVQQIEDLQCDLEKLTKYSESQERYYSSKIADLTRELREAQAAEDVRVRDVGERDGDRDRDRDRDRDEDLLDTALSSQPAGVHAFSNPLLSKEFNNDTSSGTSYGTRDEDILAAEVTNLRAKARELESQASVRSTLEKEASTLRADNKKLREMLTASMHEASNAHVEIHQLRSESNVLHAQLADVIAQFNMKREDLERERAAVDATDDRVVGAMMGGGVESSVATMTDVKPVGPCSSQRVPVPPTPNDAAELDEAGRGRTVTNDVEASMDDDEDIKKLFESAGLSLERTDQALGVDQEPDFFV